MIDTYNKLADAFEYPNSERVPRLNSLREIGVDSQSLNEFLMSVAALSLSDLQELYTRTFDLNPTCALEIGYHLFGENYKRGEFLAHLRETEAPFDLGQQAQLPDYLPVLLRLLPKLEDEELRGSLISECLIPGIEKMLASFKESDNPYQLVLAAVLTTLQSEVRVVSTEAPSFNVRATLPVIQPAPQASAESLAAARFAGSSRECSWE